MARAQRPADQVKCVRKVLQKSIETLLASLPNVHQGQSGTREAGENDQRDENC